MSCRTAAFDIGDLVRVATAGPSPTDPVGEVVAVLGDTPPSVVVRWSTGRERSYHPSGLAPA